MPDKSHLFAKADHHDAEAAYHRKAAGGAAAEFPSREHVPRRHGPGESHDVETDRLHADEAVGLAGREKSFKAELARVVGAHLRVADGDGDRAIRSLDFTMRRMLGFEE